MSFRLPVITLIAVLLLVVGAPREARPQDSPQELKDPISPTTLPVYPDSENGLKKFLENQLDAVKAGDAHNPPLQLSNITIPYHEAWFLKVFGLEEGPRFESKYEEMVPDFPNKFSQRLKRALDGQRTHFVVNVFHKPVDPSAKLARAITERMMGPVTFYSADAMSADEQSSTYLGYFFYVDGGFRYVDPELFQTPPSRIRQGGEVTAVSIISQTVPTYPVEARRRHIEGQVVLHAIIATDGTVQRIETISGNPALVEAAIDAVRQWRYKPTSINGTPVEIDTTIIVTFQLGY